MTWPAEPPWERFTVKKEAVVAALADAIERSGGRVLETIDPREAPLRVKVRDPHGQVMLLLVYAFLANEYRQGGRPHGEHRFQIKYGSDFTHYHELFIDGTRQITTLMLGVHVEAGVFVAIDPAMHTPTWFSSSFEMKARELQRVKERGWHGWERERSAARRKKEKPQANYQTEVLLGFVPERFFDYVALEMAATGIDPGERLALIERASDATGKHWLLNELGLPAGEVLDILGNAFRLHAALRGHVAERYLEKHLHRELGRQSVTRLDKDGEPDFRVRHRGTFFRIECKNTLRTTLAAGTARVDFQKTRASKADPCSRYYGVENFEVLAACLHPITSSWDFRFCPTRALEKHKTCRKKLSPRVLVEGRSWSPDIIAVLDALR